MIRQIQKRKAQRIAAPSIRFPDSYHGGSGAEGGSVYLFFQVTATSIPADPSRHSAANGNAAPVSGISSPSAEPLDAVDWVGCVVGSVGSVPAASVEAAEEAHSVEADVAVDPVVEPLAAVVSVEGVDSVAEELEEPEEDVLFSVTVPSQVSVNAPSAVLTVMVVLPAAIALTTPFSTAATPAFELLQVSPLFVALFGVTVAVRVPVAPTSRDRVS